MWGKVKGYEYLVKALYVSVRDMRGRRTKKYVP
jgi:hypothetical protein